MPSLTRVQVSLLSQMTVFVGFTYSHLYILGGSQYSYIIIIIIIISIQPEGQFWQDPEPSQVTGMALAHCILGRFLGVGCHCFPPPLDVPAFACRYLHVQAT